MSMARALAALALAAATLLVAVAWEGRSGLVLVLIGATAGAVIHRFLGVRAPSHAVWRPSAPAFLPSRSWQAEALDAAPLAIILIAPRGMVGFANRAAMAEFPGLKIGYPLSLGLRSPVLLEAATACQRDRIAQHTELEEKVPVTRSFAVLAAPLGGQETGGSRAAPDTALFLQDISGQRRLDAMRSDFVANASHELRTPLASILGFIETLRGPARADSAAREKFLEIMEAQARRMARLVDDLLSLSRIELKERLHPTGEVDLAAIVAETKDLLGGIATERGVVIMLDHPPVALPVIGDRDDLLRVFGNLTENAIKYGRSGGKVEISVSRRSATNEGVVAIRDHGPGIAPEHLPRLTERFYRIDTTQSRADGGTGLGLAIVKHIVNRHRGRLEIESKPGEGACFTVTLPCPAVQ